MLARLDHTVEAMYASEPVECAAGVPVEGNRFCRNVLDTFRVGVLLTGSRNLTQHRFGAERCHTRHKLDRVAECEIPQSIPAIAGHLPPSRPRSKRSTSSQQRGGKPLEPDRPHQRLEADPEHVDHHYGDPLDAAS